MMNSQDPLPNTIHFSDAAGQIATLDKDDLKFFPAELENKESIAKRFVECIHLNLQAALNDSVAIYMCLEDQVILTVYEKDLVLADEPTKPSDYWIFQAAKKLWKTYSSS